MIKLEYLNLYITALFGMVAAMGFGVYFFYSGMGNTSFEVNGPMGTQTYYLDKNGYEMYLRGLVYCATFFSALLLLLAAIVIPSQDQLNQRAAMSQSFAGAGVQMRQAPPMAQGPQMRQPPPMAPPQQGPPMAAPVGSAQQAAPTSKSRQPAAVEVEEDYLDDVEEYTGEEKADESGDADVVYGLARITDEATVDFIHKHPDSAIKFLFRKSLEGKPLPAAEDEIYQSWQKRGLSRGQIREYLLQIMEWEKLPEAPLHEIWSALRDQIFELTH